MTSISHYTIKEIEEGNAIDLIKEIDELYGNISDEDSRKFIDNLDIATKGILAVLDSPDYNRKSNRDKSTNAADLNSIDPRQHTPRRLTADAEKHGFVNVGCYGVHPHLLIPKLNYQLLPRVFNIISNSLCAFEKLPISLIWSSCFICVFKK